MADSGLSEYEQQRLAHIKRNQVRLAAKFLLLRGEGLLSLRPRANDPPRLLLPLLLLPPPRRAARHYCCCSSCWLLLLLFHLSICC